MHFFCFDMQEGASEADLSILPKYRYQACKDEDRVGNAAGRMVPIETSSGYMVNEQILLPEDAVSGFSVFRIQICIPPRKVVDSSLEIPGFCIAHLEFGIAIVFKV